MHYDWEYVRLHTASTAYATLLLAIYPGQLQVMMPSVLFLLPVRGFHGSKHLGRTLHRRKSDRSSFFCLLSVHVLAMSRQCFPWLGPYPCLQDRMVQEHRQLIMDSWTEVVYKHKCWRYLRIWVEDDLTQQFWSWNDYVLCWGQYEFIATVKIFRFTLITEFVRIHFQLYKGLVCPARKHGTSKYADDATNQRELLISVSSRKNVFTDSIRSATVAVSWH